MRGDQREWMAASAVAPAAIKGRRRHHRRGPEGERTNSLCASGWLRRLVHALPSRPPDRTVLLLGY